MQPNLLDYSRGLLNLREETAVRAHLDGCAACRAVLKSEITLAEKLATMPRPQPKPDVWLLVQSRIRTEQKSTRISAFEQIRLSFSRKTAVAAASVAVAIFALAATSLWQSPAPEPQAAERTSIKQAVALMQVQPIADDSVVGTTDAMMKVLEDEL